MLDVWVCSSCHSINRERAARCYKCDASRSAATGEGEGLRPKRALLARVTTPYRSTLELSFVAGLLIFFLVFLEVWWTVLEFRQLPILAGLLDGMAAGGGFDEAAWDAALAGNDGLDLATFGAYILAQLAFGTWLSVCVANVPALGGGEAPVAPARTFLYSIIPVYNLRKVPQIVQDVLYRVDPRGGGIFLVGAAWIGIVGSWIVGRVVGLYLDARLEAEAFNAESLAQFAAGARGLLDLGFALDVVITGLICLGAMALVAIMAQVERRAAARNREIEAELGTVA